MKYMIKNLITGKYSRGGTWKEFSVNGKIWSSIGAVKLHLRQYAEIPTEWVIVPLLITEGQPLGAKGLMEEHMAKVDVEAKKTAEAHLVDRVKYLSSEIERLKKELETEQNLTH